MVVCNRLKFPVLRVAIVATLALFSQGIVACSSSIPEHPSEIAFAELSYTSKRPNRFTMGNGMIVHYLHDGELPLVSGTLLLPVGSLRMGKFPTGLGVALGSQLREGGTKKIRPDALDARLDTLAASIESSMGDEFLQVGFHCLAEDFEEVFGIFADVIRQPRFDQERFELWKKLSLEGIRRRRDNPDVMASMTFEQLLFGKDSVYASTLTSGNLYALSPTKLTLFHKEFVGADGAHLVISGAVSDAQLHAAVKREFADWLPAASKLPAYPKVRHPIKPGIYVLERDFDQASVLIGHRGPPRHTNDMYAQAVFNRLFGYSGFESLLFAEIRSRLGLAYSVYGALFPDVIEGTFTVGMGTRSDAVEEAIEATRLLIQQVVTEQFPESPVADAKTAIRRSFVFKFSTPGKVAERAAYLELMGYSRNYDTTYLPHIEAVTPASVHDVAKKWLHPERLVTVVVGRVSPDKLAEKYGKSHDVFELSFDEVPHVVRRVSR